MAHPVLPRFLRIHKSLLPECHWDYFWPEQIIYEEICNQFYIVARPSSWPSLILAKISPITVKSSHTQLCHNYAWYWSSIEWITRLQLNHWPGLMVEHGPMNEPEAALQFSAQMGPGVFVNHKDCTQSVVIIYPCQRYTTDKYISTCRIVQHYIVQWP